MVRDHDKSALLHYHWVRCALALPVIVCFGLSAPLLDIFILTLSFFGPVFSMTFYLFLPNLYCFALYPWTAVVFPAHSHQFLRSTLRSRTSLSPDMASSFMPLTLPILFLFLPFPSPPRLMHLRSCVLLVAPVDFVDATS
ncbi:hypothetical protein R3P38DRAFT_1328917 [Favolaschia claudopus]|uniref:Uncharacterized protein n=1 Tax=Favolaschia claudopus TaxID=2862362 RepID=A0AAW0AVQ6_9AGAR